MGVACTAAGFAYTVGGCAPTVVGVASTAAGRAFAISHFNDDGEGWLVTGRSISDVSSEGHETCGLMRRAWVVRCG